MDQSNFPPADANPLLERLMAQYDPLLKRADELTEALARVPAQIDEQSLDKAAGFVKQIKAAASDADKARKAEGEDYLRAKRNVDSFFGAIVDRLKDAAAQVERRMQVYLDEKAAAERRRRQEEERKAREEAERLAAEARRVREEEDRRAREAAEAEAARIAALTPKVDPAEALAAQREAAEAAQAAERQRIAREAEALEAARRAQEEADRARRAADAKPADLVRTRGALGGTATLVTSIDFEIEDRIAAVITLAAHFDDAAIDKAARALVRARKDEIRANVASGGRGWSGIRFYETTTARVA